MDNEKINNSEPVKKRGRPKGSTDKQERKKRIDRDIQTTDTGKNTITTKFAMALNSLPKIDINNPEEVNNRINEYYSICAAFDLKPTIAMLAFAFGVNRGTLFNWINGRTETLQNKESFNAIKNAFNLIASLYETYLNDGSMTPVSAFFLMKNNYGYKDTTDYIVTAKQEKAMDLNDIVSRSGLLSE